MNRQKLILYLLLLPCVSLGQSPSNPRVQLENGILSGSFGPEMNLFQDTEGDSAHHSLQMNTVAYGEPQSLVYSSALWYGGISDNQLYMTASMYNTPAIDDPCYSGFGPISNAYGPMYEERYNRVWLFDRLDIEDHINQFDSPGYVVPENLASYPGNGRSEFGESHLLLPFVDVNDDGFYEPELGDYPNIRGDRCVTWVVNDGSNGAEDRPQVETIIQAYTFMQGPEELLHAMFVNAQLRNRSDRDYTDFSLGVFMDADVNHFMDNYAGCDPNGNYAYTYYPLSADPESWDGSLGMPSNVAAFFPEDEMHSHMVFSLSSSAENGRPTEPEHYHHYLNAKWKNGQPLTYGGDGFNVGGGNNPDLPAQFMFPDFYWALDGAAWHEFPTHPPTDRRQVMSIAPQEFDAGGAICFHYAFVASADTNAIDALYMMDDRIDALQSWWDANGETACMDPAHPLSTGELDAVDARLTLHPNPTSGLLRVQGLIQTDSHPIQISDLSGRILMASTLVAGQSQLDVRALPSGMYVLCLPEEGKALPFVRD